MAKTRQTYMRRYLLSTPGPGPGPVSPPSLHRTDLDPSLSSTCTSIPQVVMSLQVLQIMSPNNTIYLGQATSIASLLLAASTKGERRSFPNAIVMIHQPSGRYNESKLAPVDYELRSLMADFQGTKFLAPNSPMGRPRFSLGSSNKPRRP
ncbi:hypothetical protein ACFX11_035451 [Malus domestica]